MRWKKKVQQLCRVQLPTDFMKAYQHNPGDSIEIEDDSNGRLLIIRFVGGRKK